MFWVSVAIIVLFWLYEELKRFRDRPKPCPHGSRRECGFCVQEAKARAAAEAKALAVANEERLHWVMEAYNSIDEATRTRIRTIVEERDQQRAHFYWPVNPKLQPGFIEEEVLPGQC
jgi:hypothetical protein